MQPLVSIVIPNYNHASYLPERIDSVLAQTYPNYEIIILDDCSTDNSREVIERYRGNNHVSQIVYNEQNSGGVFKQWKKGITLARGDFIWIAESDDKSDPLFLETLVRCFTNYDNLALAFCKSLLFDGKGKTWTMDTEGLNEGVYDSHAFISRFMSRSCVMLNASSCLFSKKAFERIDDLYTTFKCSGDRMFWTLISEQGNIAVIDSRLNYYRKHLTNVTAGGFSKGINQRETKVIMDYILNKGYISKKEYGDIRRKYLKKFVFELLTDKNIKTEIYKYWNFNVFQQFSLRIEAYINKFIKR